MRTLSFHKQVLQDLVKTDALVIFGQGLGVERVLVSLLGLYNNPGTLVFVLNVDHDQSRILEEMQSLGGSVAPMVINNQYSSDDRTELYLRGGVLIVTPRILIVDLLNKRVPIHLITGFVVNKAHKVVETSMEAFILRVYRAANRTGFIKAFSEDPEGFSAETSKLTKVLRHLFLKQVYLWPRFHMEVQELFQDHEPDLVEIPLEMSPTMTSIQSSLVRTIDDCLKEIKKLNRTVDVADINLETGLARNIERIVRQQLDPVWHKTGGKTRVLVNDLQTLRQLLIYLPQWDCVTFFDYLETVVTFSGQGLRSYWIMMDHANNIFQMAKWRIFRRGKLEITDTDDGTRGRRKANARKKRKPAQTTLENPASNTELRLALEVNPKWEVLDEILLEIESENANPGGPTLIVVSNEKLCHQLRSYLVKGSDRMMKEMFCRWGEAKLSKVAKSAWSAELRDISRTVEEVRSEIEELGETIDDEEGTTHFTLPIPLNPDRDQIKGKQSSVTAFFGNSSKGNEKEGVIKRRKLEKPTTKPTASSVARPSSSSSTPSTNANPIQVLPREGTVVVAKTDSSEFLLQDLKPRNIIMYEPDSTFIRRVEVYKAESPGVPVRVYFLTYSESVEHQKFLTSIKREKDAFENLIRERAHMVIPDDQDQFKAPVCEETTNTRRAGRKAIPKEQDKVIIDVREFRSTLPSILHQRGFSLEATTLEVGDYILSPEIVIERKSVSDLLSSLANGRLYHQAEAMTRFYSRPVLLIEFDLNKSFSLQSVADIGQEISPSNPISKLSLLALHFPDLRIFWSKSPYMTVDIFKRVKEKQQQPDIAQAIEIRGDGKHEENVNMTPQDVLRRLPGVTSQNYRSIIRHVKNLKALCSLSQNRLEEIMGMTYARKLYNFLHTPFQQQDEQAAKVRPQS